MKALFTEEIQKTIKLLYLLNFFRKFKTMEKLDLYMRTIYQMFGGMREVSVILQDFNTKLKGFV